MATPRPQRSTLLILGVIATILLGWVLHVGADIIQPLVIALLLASMLQPIVSWLSARYIPPPVTVLLVVSGLFFVLLQVGLIFQANVQAFLGEAAAVERSLDEGEGEDPPTEGETLQIAEGVRPWVDPSEMTESTPTAPGEVPTAKPRDEVAQDTDPEASEGADTGQEGADPEGQETDGETGILLEGPIGEMFDRQQTVIQESGGWEGIKAGIRSRIERAEHLPEEIQKYALRVWDEFDPAGLAENLALTGYGFVRSLVLVLIYMVFIFAESAIFRRKILTIAGDRQSDAAEILDRIGRGIQRYLGVKTVVSFLTGSLCYLVLVALEIPYALLFGFITFALNYIPTFGSIVAGIFPTITALAVEASLLKAVLVIVTYLAVNLSLGSFIEPRILGRELNLSPLVVVISVVVWAGLWGVVGGFLAVPLTAAMQIILASNDTTYPIAVMLGSGPGRGRRGDPDPPDGYGAAA